MCSSDLTQSYWSDLCRNVLGRDLHHDPSQGGDAEDHRHSEWYKETLQLYRDVFGYDARPDIWIRPMEAAWPYPEEPSERPDSLAIVAIVGLLILPFVFTGLVFNTYLPFLLTGLQFLAFFPVYAVALMLAYAVYRWQSKPAIEAIAEAYFPKDVNSFQVADFLFHRQIGRASCRERV